jgi:glycerol-3-phosphate acyltransferase PlsX
LTLSIDAMGGENAPEMVVAGIDIVRKTLPDAEFLLFGDRAKIDPLLDAYPNARAVCTTHHTDEMITDDAKPSVALRSGRGSSMRLAINAVGDGQAAGVISSGNTGALMAMAKFVLKTLPGIARPAISAYFPTQRGESVMLDLGANIECDADNLVQFAVMGEVFARHVLGLDQPTIGILNVGAEGPKGNEAVKQASAILKESPLPIKFHGFVEGDDIGAGVVDVIVTDGFTGNIALKMAEGTAHMLTRFLKEAMTSSLLARLGALLMWPALNSFRRRIDPRRYNGAMFVGLNGICIKSHGGTDALGFANAIEVAADLIRRDFNERIKEDLERLISEPPKPKATVI